MTTSDTLLTLRDLPKYEALLALAQRYPDLKITAVEACLMFLRTATDFYGVMDQHFGRHGLSTGKFMVLMLLKCAGETGLTPSECADRAGVTRGTMTGLLEGLAREGLIQRQTHPQDRRCTLVHLSDRGYGLLDGMLPEHFQTISALLSPLSVTEQKTLFSLLEKQRAGAVAIAHPTPH
ncbi:MAG: MarR family transcriptional regulator [Leptolyngbya sp.]|nr:MarR family transcriptional regulator [Leptolyngbya sp.]